MPSALEDATFVQNARDNGYKDEEIYDHLAKVNPAFGKMREAGYGFGEVFNHISEQANKLKSSFASNLQTLATSPEASSIPVSDAITQQNQFYEATRLPGQPALIPGTVAPSIAEVHAEASKPIFGTIPYLPDKYENLISKIPTVTGIDNATMSRALIDTANFFQSPEGIGTAFIGAAPAAVRNIAGYLFAGMALKNAPETVRNWVNAKTETEKRQAGAQMIETGLMLTPIAEAGLHGRIPTEVLKHTDAVPSDVLKEAAKEPSHPEVADAARNELGKRAEQLYQDVSPVLTDFDGPTQDTIRGAIEKQGRGEDLSIPERQAVQAARDLASTKAAANAPISTRPPSQETASPAGRAAVPPSPSAETTRLSKDAQPVAPETAKALTLFHGSDRPIGSLSIPETLSENKGDLRGHVKAAFLTADESLAKTYSQIKAGPEGSAVVTKFTASPDAKILREGSPEFAQLEIEASKISGENQVVRRAAFIVNEATKRGWDAVHFKDEGNLGVVVTNPEAFSPAVEPAERTGGPAKPQAAGEPDPIVGPALTNKHGVMAEGVIGQRHEHLLDAAIDKETEIKRGDTDTNFQHVFKTKSGKYLNREDGWDNAKANGLIKPEVLKAKEMIAAATGERPQLHSTDLIGTEEPKGGEPSAKEPDTTPSTVSDEQGKPPDQQAKGAAQEGDTRTQTAEVRKTVSAYATKIGGSMGKMIEAVLNQGKSVEEAKADTGFIGDAQAAVDKAKRYLAAVKKVEPLAERSFKEEPTGEKVESPEMEQLKTEAEQDKGTGGGTMTRRILPGELGVVPKGTKELLETPELIRNTVKDITDSVGVQSIPKSSRAGIAPSVIQHASSRLYVPRLVDDLLSRVFPDSYKDGDAMAKTMDIINKDNVLGGYDAIIKKMTDALEAGDGKTAQEAEQEANQIERAHDMNALARDVEAARNDPQISANIALWEKEVVPLMDSLYNEMKNVDPNTPRETRGRFFGARVNLLPENLAEQMKQWTDPSKPLPETPVSNFRNPNVKRDQFARKATLTGSYSTDANLVLLNSFGRRWNEVTKLRMYNDIVEKGVGEFVEPGTPPPDKLKGEKVGRLAVKVPETNPETGKTSMVEKSLYVQKQLVPELRNALDTDMKFTPHPIFKAITNLQLFQLADASAHIKNIHSVIVNALGRSAAWKDLVTKIPALGSIDAVTEITKVAREISADSPEIRKEIAEMAKSGMVRPDYPATGLQKITKMQELIHDVDTAARVIMNRRFNNLVDAGIATDTPMNRRNFVQQIGEYNARLMGRYERAFRDIGLSPFIVAGRTFNRFSRRLITGNPGFEATDTAGAVKARAMQMSGLVAAATIPAFVNMFTTGTPFGRPGTPIGAVDLGPQFDTEDGKRRGIDVMNLVGIRRGLRSTGINAAIEGLRQGKTPNQIAGDAANDIITTATHPWIGPGLGAVSQVLTGKRLDLRSGWDIVESKKVGGAGQYLENARVALRQQNPFLYGLFSEKLGTDEGKTVAQQIVSGLLKSPLSAIGYKEFNTPAVAFAKSIPTMGQITPSKDERFKLLKQIEQTRKTDPAKANEMLSHAFADDKLTVADLKSNKSRITKPDYLSRKVARLSPQESVDVFRLATKEERQMIGVQVLHKITSATSLPRSEMKQLIDDYKKIAATPAQPDPKFTKR